jgi:large subunit ribosomal protein L31
MKSGIHPEYHEIMVTCACGETFLTRSTSKEIRLEICSKCHPFFTGKQKLIDSAGRVERFTKRYKDTSAPPAATRKPTSKKAVAKGAIPRNTRAKGAAPKGGDPRSGPGGKGAGPRAGAGKPKAGAPSGAASGGPSSGGAAGSGRS